MAETQLNFSGGKDSTAMLLHLIEIGKRPDRVIFADTLLEFPEMYDFVDKVEEHIGQKIIRTRPKHTFFGWFYGSFKSGRYKGQRRGFPYVTNKCWYQREAKVYAMKEYTKKANTVYIGYAKGEEHRRMKDSKFEYPLIEWGWTEKMCMDYCIEKGLLNPLYEKFNRLGCFLCPKQSKKSLEIVKKDYPALWNIIEQLKRDSPHGFKIGDKLRISNDQVLLEKEADKL